MTVKIQVVLNLDRCHVSQDGSPLATFLYSNYEIPGMSDREAAITIAESFAFNRAAELSKESTVKILLNESK